MPDEEYLLPEDVGSGRAREILDFLNVAQTAEQIAEAIEMPGELDVGIRVAQRILDRRGQLGGFTNLQQVADVPLVGSERFTEIVTAFSRPRVREVPPATSAALLHEVRALREQVKALQAALGGQYRVVLRALQERPFLGQTVNLVATVTEAGRGRPRIDAPLTFATTWGRLRAVEGVTIREGSSVTVRTDGDGMARVTLLPPTSEALLPVQQGTLETALRLLNRAADDPRAAKDGLRRLAEQYRWDGNPQLRQAIDIYFRDFGAGLLESINTLDHMLAWSYIDSTVLAHVRDGAEEGQEATAVHATAALSLRFKNWLGPWLETMQTVAQEESQLAEDLARAKEIEEAGTLLGEVYGRVRDFVSDQRGLVGDYVGRRVAQASLRDFLQTETGDLPKETRFAIFPTLDVASQTVASSGVNVLAAVGSTHVNLQRDLNQKINRVETEQQELGQKIDEVDTEGIRTLATTVDNLQSRVATFDETLENKVDATDFDAALSSKLGVTQFTTFQDRITAELTERVDTTTFNAALAAKVDGTTFDSRLVRLDSELRQELDNRIVQVETESIEVLTTRLNSLESEFSRIPTDLESIEALVSRVGEIETQMATKVDTTVFDAAINSKLDATRFDSFETEVSTRLDRKVDATTLDTALASTVDRETFNTHLGALRTRVSELDITLPPDQ